MTIDKVNHFLVIFLVFVVCTSSINGQETCPTGKPSIQSPCDSSAPCPSSSICYRKNNAFFCCGDLGSFCTTKMHTFNSKDGGSYVWGPGDNIDKWYNLQMGRDVVACPFPYSFAYSNNKKLKVLPVDFEPSKPESSKPKACNKNSDCKKDNGEFCGAASHPSFPEELDKSGEGGIPLKFCYKFQTFGSINVEPVITSQKTELKGCDTNSDCDPDEGTETFCFIEDTLRSVQIAENNGKIAYNKGCCAFHPTKKTLWWYMLAGSIVSTVICLGVSVTFFVVYRKSATATELPTKTDTTGNTTGYPSYTELRDIQIKHQKEWMEQQQKKKPSKETTASSSGL